MVEGVREQALSAGLIDVSAWKKGIADLKASAGADGVLLLHLFQSHCFKARPVVPVPKVGNKNCFRDRILSTLSLMAKQVLGRNLEELPGRWHEGGREGRPFLAGNGAGRLGCSFPHARASDHSSQSVGGRACAKAGRPGLVSFGRGYFAGGPGAHHRLQKSPSIIVAEGIVLRCGGGVGRMFGAGCGVAGARPGQGLNGHALALA